MIIMTSRKNRIWFLLIAVIMLYMANVQLYAETIIPDVVIIEESFNGEGELIPMRASGCYQYWVPDSWNLQYMDQTMAKVAQSNGWSLGSISVNSSNERTQILYGASGGRIGSYHIDHKLLGRITQAHYHLDSNSTNIHYVVYR